MNEFSTLNGYKVKDKKATRFYDNVESMINDTTLKEDMLVITKGYYNVNDGGGSEYHITSTQSQTEYQETLNNNLYANLINNKVINIKQLGAYGDGVHDDTLKIQTAFNLNVLSLYFPEGSYKITETLEINKSMKIEGEFSTLYNRLNTDVPSAFLYWDGEDDSTMLKIDDNRRTYGLQLYNIGFDGNLKDVLLLDLTRAKYSRIINCSFNRFENGIYISGNAYHNIIEKCFFQNFTGKAINIDQVSNVFANSQVIKENAITLSNNDCYGIYVSSGNSHVIINNFIEGKGYPITLYGSYVIENEINGNRIETLFNKTNGDIPRFAISIINTNNTNDPRYSPHGSKICNNQIFSQIIINNVTAENPYYNLLDDGCGTIYDGISNYNLVPNGACLYINNDFEKWNTNSEHITFSPSTDQKMNITVSSEIARYPSIYQFVDVKYLRGKFVVLSSKFKAQDISTTPKIEAMTYKGGNKTLANKGTLLTSAFHRFLINESNTYFIQTSKLYIPEDAEDLFININTNGSGATVPHDNVITVDFINISDRFVTDMNKYTDIIMKGE